MHTDPQKEFNKEDLPEHEEQRLHSEQEKKIDLKDSPRDAERLQPEEATLELPDVSDIPGQENVPLPEPHELGDATIASSDEEGIGLFPDDSRDDTSIQMGTEADISREERAMLDDDSYMPTQDEDRLRRSALDQQDTEGEPLNEESLANDRTGEDLDIPERPRDRASDAMDQGDEENNHYSLGSDSKDNLTEGTP